MGDVSDIKKMELGQGGSKEMRKGELEGEWEYKKMRKIIRRTGDGNRKTMDKDRAAQRNKILLR